MLIMRGLTSKDQSRRAGGTRVNRSDQRMPLSDFKMPVVAHANHSLIDTTTTTLTKRATEAVKTHIRLVTEVFPAPRWTETSKNETASPMSAFTPLLWSILPSQLTHILIPYLSSFLPLLFPPSAKGTPGYQQNYRRAYTALVVGYLTYTFVASEGVWDWYAILGVSKDVDDDGLKRAYRRL